MSAPKSMPPALNSPKLAAVIVNYGTIDQTIRCVEALRRSSLACRSVFVVDNGSRPEETEFLQRSLPWVEVIALPTNLGFSGGANAGIRAALKGDVEAVLLLNSDAEMQLATLSVMTAAMAKGAALVGPAIVRSDDPSQLECLGISYSVRTGRMRLRGWDTTLPRSPRPTMEVDALSGCALLVRRDVFERVGLLDERYFYSFEDVEFCLRARGAGFRAVCAAEAVVAHQGSQSIGRNSPQRHYFAARNHLLLANETSEGPLGPLRQLFIVCLNVLHASRESGRRSQRVAAAFRGVRDYMRGTYGAG